jgi:hypothetical protein
MRDRLRRVVRLVGPVLVTLIAAGAAGAAAIYVTGPSGLVSCVPVAAPAGPEAVPRWVIAAGIPALVAALVGAFFALGAQRVLSRMIGVLLAIALGGATFAAVYVMIPAACRP